jgi:hypothetical protein
MHLVTSAQSLSTAPCASPRKSRRPTSPPATLGAACATLPRCVPRVTCHLRLLAQSSRPWTRHPRLRVCAWLIVCMSFCVLGKSRAVPSPDPPSPPCCLASPNHTLGNQLQLACASSWRSTIMRLLSCQCPPERLPTCCDAYDLSRAPIGRPSSLIWVPSVLLVHC